MSKQSTLKRRIFPVVFMLAITLIFISITTVIYTITKDTIELNESLRLKKAVLYSGGISVPEDPVEVENLYNTRVKEIADSQGEIIYYEIRGFESSTIESYVISSSGPGLWGRITCIIGFDRDIRTFKGLEIIDQNETPGLGGRIGEPWFKEQFRGKRAPLTYVPEGAAPADNEFQAITGASYSTTAIKEIMNSAIEYAQQVIAEQQ